MYMNKGILQQRARWGGSRKSSLDETLYDVIHPFEVLDIQMETDPPNDPFGQPVQGKCCITLRAPTLSLYDLEGGCIL